MNMNQAYDTVIAQHYRKIAQEFALSPSSTMVDEYVRQAETDAIVAFVELSLTRRQKLGITQPARIVDVGCGNGYTLQVLTKTFPNQSFIGIEKTTELRDLAASRFPKNPRVTIQPGDVRDASTLNIGPVDILLCQRVLINLLDAADQAAALDNLIDLVAPPQNGKPGGALLFIEAFETPLGTLNVARGEFDLPPLPPAHHNLYLGDTFFQHTGLRPFSAASEMPPPNFLSTHYFVARVLHATLLGERPFKRNSEFVRFFTAALKPYVGDYAPVKLCAFDKA
jgi:SAM-dependent methyltransferase